MKKCSVLVFVFLVMLMSFSSCIKKYTCQCTISYSGQPGLPDASVKEYTIKDNKSKAKSLCEQNSYSTDNSGVHTSENCKLY